MSMISAIRRKLDSLHRKALFFFLRRQWRRHPREMLFWCGMSPFMLGCAHALIKLGAADALHQSSRSVKELAAICGAKEMYLYRVLRSMAQLGFLRRHEGSVFSLTAAGALLHSGHPQSLADYIVSVTETYMPACAHILGALRDETPPMVSAYGQSMWDYYRAHPEQGAVFDRWMAGFTAQQAQAILSVYDFSRFGRIADIGGGRGVMLAALLKAHPGLQGTLYDQPAVIRQASSVMEEAGVADRCRLESGNFMESVPAGMDAYIVKHVFHDWDDASVKKILHSIRRAIGTRMDAQLLIIEGLVERPALKGETLRQWCDIAQMVWTCGRERTAAEYAALFSQTGFEPGPVTPTSIGDVMVIEARPVPSG